MAVASVSMIVVRMSSPAACIVVPVSTRSTTASASPSWIADSTEPDTYLTCVGRPTPS